MAIIVALIVIAFQTTQQKSRDFAKAVSSIASGGVEAITLGPNWLAVWDHSKISSLAHQFESLGFRRIGVFAVNEMPGLELYPMHSDRYPCFAIIYRIAGGDWVWFEVMAPLEGGGWIVVSSAPTTASYKTKPGSIRVSLNDVSPKLAMTAFLRDIARFRRAVSHTTENDFETVFARAYAEAN